MNTPAWLQTNQLGIQLTEESATWMNLHAQISSALLCSGACVDAQKTNSLCCAAAGITACVCANAEALLPHQKLRGAATPHATLNAQNRPPAQPVEGYTQAQVVASAQEAV
jgi:hypothetical protein